MKNNAKYLFCISFLLMLGSSFVSGPAPVNIPANNREIGGAYVLFAGKFGGEITKQEMENQTEIVVDGCSKGARIFDFTLSITKNGKTSTLKTNSSVLTEEMRTQLKNLKKGDAFEFLNTKAYWGGDTKDVVDAHGKKFIVV